MRPPQLRRENTPAILPIRPYTSFNEAAAIAAGKQPPNLIHFCPFSCFNEAAAIAAGKPPRRCAVQARLRGFNEAAAIAAGKRNWYPDTDEIASKLQ